MNEILFALDQNLGFHLEDPKWQQFFKKFNIKPILYLDLDQLSDEVKKNNVSFCYLPSANYFSLKSNPNYTPIANALFTSNHTCHINSLLIVSKESQIHSLEELKGKRYGYINTSCTSSYFAPAILLQKNGFSFPNFFSTTEPVGAWQLQINAVIAGKVDATMVQEDVWHALPSNADKTIIIDQVNNLPSPLILCANHVQEELKQEFLELLFSYKSDPHALFSGFIPFQHDLVQTFFDEASRAFNCDSKCNK